MYVVLKNNLAKNDIFVISRYGPFICIHPSTYGLIMAYRCSSVRPRLVRHPPLLFSLFWLIGSWLAMSGCFLWYRIVLVCVEAYHVVLCQML
jgi:hypothetical protein